MTGEAFRRLAILAGSIALVLALAFVWRYMGWLTALIVAVGGVAVAVLMTVETEPSPPRPTSMVSGARRGFSIAEIASRARAGEDDDA